MLVNTNSGEMPATPQGSGHQMGCELQNSPENAVVANAFAALLNRPEIVTYRGCRRILSL
jgi:hypothetical protein